jgi:hypothetical protein
LISEDQIGGRQIGGSQVSHAGCCAEGGVNGNSASGAADRDVLKAVLGTNWAGECGIAHDDSSHAS